MGPPQVLLMQGLSILQISPGFIVMSYLIYWGNDQPLLTKKWRMKWLMVQVLLEYGQYLPVKMLD